MDPTLTIGQVAEAAGLNASAVRYYERVGVLPVPERASGQRRYGPETIDRLRTVRTGQQAGFSLDEIGKLLRGAEDGRADTELRELAERKLPDIDALIERAQAMKEWLEAATDCRCGSLDVCGLFSGDEPHSKKFELSPSGPPAGPGGDNGRGKETGLGTMERL